LKDARPPGGGNSIGKCRENESKLNNRGKNPCTHEQKSTEITPGSGDGEAHHDKVGALGTAPTWQPIDPPRRPSSPTYITSHQCMTLYEHSPSCDCPPIK